MKMVIRTDGLKGWAERGRERAKKIDRGEKIAPSRSFTFESPERMLELLSVQRIRLCEVARTQEFTITSLAAALGRDPKSVRRDIRELTKYGFIRTREQVNPGHGRVKIVEPVAKSFHLSASF